jgi:hypothetical protein
VQEDDCPFHPGLAGLSGELEDGVPDKTSRRLHLPAQTSIPAAKRIVGLEYFFSPTIVDRQFIFYGHRLEDCAKIVVMPIAVWRKSVWEMNAFQTIPVVHDNRVAASTIPLVLAGLEAVSAELAPTWVWARV